MHSNDTTTPWEQTKNSFKSFMDKAKKNTSRVIPTFKARVEDLPESLAG